MTIGLNNKVSIEYRKQGSVIKEDVEPSRVEIVAQALGIVGAIESNVYIFKNFNHTNQLNRIDIVKNGDYIEIIDKALFDNANSSHKEPFRLEQDIINIRNIINDLKTRPGNEEDIQYLELLLSSKESELSDVLILRGIKSTNVMPIRTYEIDHTPEPPVTGTDILTPQVITVMWDNVDRFISYEPVFPIDTGPSEIVDINITFETDDGEAFDRDVTVVIDILFNTGGGVTEGVGYVITNFTKTITAGTLPADAAYIATFQSFNDEGPPEDFDMELTSDDAIPIPSTPHPLIVTWSPVV